MNHTLEQNKKAVHHFIYMINKYEFRGGKFGDGLFLNEHVNDEIRFYKKNIDTAIADKIDKLYVDIHELKGYCLRYIQIYQLKEDNYDGLLNELLLDLYSIPNYSYGAMFSFIGKMHTKFSNMKKGMLHP